MNTNSFGDVSIRKVYIEFTQRCNLNCISCFRQNWDLPSTQMTQESFDSVLSSLNSIQTLEEIVIGGIGEPTIHPNFIQWVKKLPKVKLTITTNAYAWSDEIIACLAGDFDKVVISVDGLEETFMTIRNFSLKKLNDNIQKLKQRKERVHHDKPFIIAQTVLSEYNINEIDLLIPQLAKMGFMRLILSHLLPQNEKDQDKIVYTLHDNPRLKELKYRWLNTSLSNQIQIQYPNFELKTERKCVFIEDGTLTINSDGNIAPCYRFAHPSIEYVFGRRKRVFAVSYGSIQNQSIQTIWESKLYTDLRIQNLRNKFPSCPDCDLVQSCDYINDSLCDCNGQNPSCGDCLWTRHFVQCI